jgi:uncharacterized protein YciI
VSAPPVFFVLFHSPGPRWSAGMGFREQPGVGEHIAYMAAQAEAGLLVIGGPFLDDSGGMMVLRADSPEAARAIAESDPTVQDGLLLVEVKPWMAAMRTVSLGRPIP